MPPKPANARLSHFLCIPLITSTSQGQLQTTLNTFRSDVITATAFENVGRIPEKAIRPLRTLHLTLGVMSLLTAERVESALAVLKSLNLTDLLATTNPEMVTDHSTSKTERPQDPLKVTLRGLKSMHTAQKTSILYASPVDEDGQLQAFCLKLKEAFKDLLVSDTRPLLLHATIVNTIYVPGVRGKGSGHGKNRARLTIDAREVLERYRDFDWMKDVKLEKVAICRMGAKKMDDGNEEYVVEGEIDMP